MGPSSIIAAAGKHIKTKESSKITHAKFVYSMLDSCIAQIKSGDEILVEGLAENGEGGLSQLDCG